MVLPPAQVNPEWAQVGGSASKSYGHLALPENPGKVWTARITGSSDRERLGAAPVIGGDMLFAVGSDGTIHAFNRQSGARVWRSDAEMSDDMRPSAFGGGVSYDNGRVQFIGCHSATLTKCVNAAGIDNRISVDVGNGTNSG